MASREREKSGVTAPHETVRKVANGLHEFLHHAAPPRPVPANFPAHRRQPTLATCAVRIIKTCQ